MFPRGATALSQRSSSAFRLPTQGGMAQPRAGTRTADCTAAALRWISRLRGAELPSEVTALIVITFVAMCGCLLAASFPIGVEEPVGLLRTMAAAAGLISV